MQSLKARCVLSGWLVGGTRKGTRILCIGLLSLVLFTLMVTTAEAQFKASLRGTVADPSGAVIPGARLSLRDKSTNQTQIAQTNASGVYTFNALAPDVYELTIAQKGFERKVLSDVSIQPEQANALNIQLSIGSISQTVTISGVTSALTTDTATISQTITGNQIQHMPSFDRNVFSLAELAPGVFGDASQSAGGGSYTLPGNQGPGAPSSGASGIFATENGPQIQAAGSQYETNGISVDGISTSSAVWGGTSVITPSEDSVADMKVISNDYNAASGRFSGGQIEITTRSGSNHLHGSFFFKASRPGLNAYQAWNGVGSTLPGTAAERGLNRDNSRFNNYGGSLGGPLWKNRIFAFFNWESSPLSSMNTGQGWYETPQFDKSAAAAGSIAAKYLSYPGETPAAATLIAQTCANVGLQQGVNCQQENGGLDVGSPLKSTLGYQDLTYGGSTGTPGIGGGLDGIPDIGYYTIATPSNTSQNQYNGRLDANITSKDRLTFSIYWVPVTSTFYNGPARAANLWHHSQVNDAFTLLWLHTFSPTLINQARGNAAGWRWNEMESNPQEPFGLPQDNIDGIGTASVGYFGAPGPSHYNQWTYSYSDTLTKTLGNQNINIGGELTRLYYLNDPIAAARPTYNFHNLWDFANDAPYFESGTFNHATGLPFANRQDARVNIWGFFLQDDWKAMQNLTINMGLRWSYFGSYYAKQNNLDVLRLGTGADSLAGMHVQVGGSLYQPSKVNFGPQIGFAYQPKQLEGKMVFRGGFGVNYNQNEIAITANGFGNPPNAVRAAYTCGYPYTNNPNCAGTGILYQTADNIRSIFGYPPNPSAITSFDSNNLPLSGQSFLTGFPKNPSTITNYHYSFGFEYQLPYHLVAALGYQGSASRHLITQYNYNVLSLYKGDALNPRVNFLDYYDNRAKGNYNGMIASLTHNFAHGLQLEAQYGWSKSMDEGSGPYEEDPYPFDGHAAYARSDYDVRNDFKLFGMWQPNFFRVNSWEEKVIGGWTISGIWNAHSGFPWTPIYNTVSNLYYQGSGYSQLRPAAIVRGYRTSTSKHVYEQATNSNYGSNASKYFIAPQYAAGVNFPNYSLAPTPGIERNVLNAPGYSDLDGSLSKAFALPDMKLLGDNAKVEIRADAYNLLNMVNINPSSIQNVIGTVNPNGQVAHLQSNFGTATSALGSRTIQLQARFSF